MPRTARGFIPHFELDPRGSTPLFRQIERGLRDAIVSETLAGGARIPSTRALANALGVSRTTVLLAFDQLLADGLVVSVPGGGTFVTRDIPERERVQPPEEPSVPTQRLSGRGAALSRGGRLPTDANAGPRPFSLALFRGRDFPYEAWSRAQTGARHVLTTDFAEGGPAGHPRLRESAARFLRASRGISCTPDQVVVVANVQEALHLAGTLLMDPGDRFWHADPGHSAHRSILGGVGGFPVGLPVDAHGLRVDRGTEVADDARLAVVTPAAEFPLGTRMSPQRRKELLAWARRSDAYIVENDWDPTPVLVGRPVPALASSDPDGRVIYVAGLARAFAPVVRLALMVVPPRLVEAVVSVRRREQLRGVLEGQPALLPQTALAEFIDRGSIESMARGSGHRERHRRLVELLEVATPDGWTVDPGDGLTYVVVWLGEGRRDQEVVQELAAAGIESLPVSAFCFEGTPRNGIVLGSAAFGEETLREGVSRAERVFAGS